MAEIAQMTATAVKQRLAERLQDQLLAAEQLHRDTLYLALDKRAIVPAATVLVEELGARFVITVAVDRRQLEGGYGVLYIFSLDPSQLFVVLDCKLDEADRQIDSITPVVPGAGWSERESYDAVGIRAAGHPDPRRLMLADDWPEGVHPLLRDFSLHSQPPAVEDARPELLEPPEGASVVPMGPFFPVLEEPAYFRLFVAGETIVGCDYRGFYNHRGIEKMGDSSLTYNSIPYVAERICGICGFIHSTCYCQAVEKAASITVPRRARYLRTLLLELERVHSHLLWLGIAAHILGFDTVLMQTWRMREPIMWLCEALTGNRKTYGMNTIGGVRRDFPDEQRAKLMDVVASIEKETGALRRAILGDTTLQARTRGVGVLTSAWARKVCVAGPPARASGVKIDARIDHPYAAYDEVPPQLQAQTDGDTWARVLVRIDELLDSIRIIREVMDRLPDGPICAAPALEIPPSRIGVSVVEAPRGEAVHVVMTGGDNRPFRWRVRAPTYPNLQAVPAMIQGGTLADVPITVGSLDPCFSCTERVEVVDLSARRATIYTQSDLVGMAPASRRREGKR